eukprot:2505740-Alexandrium_andersonii.AAC.1
MSASLVGSEMCIRDSVDGATAPRSHAQERLCGRRWRRRLRLRDVAVSYTHPTLPTICSV